MGLKEAGNLERLKSDSGGIIEVTKVDKVECRGEKISSTCIRERILNGRVDELPDFLGRCYEIEGNWDGESLTFYLTTHCHLLDNMPLPLITVMDQYVRK